MMNIKDYDFEDLLDPASNLDDVEFKILDENSQELGTVRSHKFLLSLLSPVLKKMFMSRENGSIVVSRPSSNSDTLEMSQLLPVSQTILH